MLTHHVFRYNTEFVEQVPGESRFARVHMTHHDHTELRLVFVLHNHVTIIVQLLSILSVVLRSAHFLCRGLLSGNFSLLRQPAQQIRHTRR